ncbi:MAG: hypothetical protein KC589_07265 [Nanoarchaeota archaeon]|nr:hypothetical protein [Nanoarchaeota archaeon]MCA9496721.1 hypothetical protein [Nanoarchaeota archaeon]
MKPKLEIVVSNKTLGLTVETNTLIESAFCMIAAYFGKHLDNVYFESIAFLNDSSRIYDFFPQTNIYEIDTKLWENRVSLQEYKFRVKYLNLKGKPKQLLENLVIYYSTFPNNVVPNLNAQEVFNYATYLFFEDFLRFLSRDETIYPFPKIEEKLKDPNLNGVLRTALENPQNTIILPNPDTNPNMCFGIWEN